MQAGYGVHAVVDASSTFDSLSEQAAMIRMASARPTTCARMPPRRFRRRPGESSAATPESPHAVVRGDDRFVRAGGGDSEVTAMAKTGGGIAAAIRFPE